MFTKVLAAVAAVLLTISARADGGPAPSQPPAPAAGAKAPGPERTETAATQGKYPRKQEKSGDPQKPEAKGAGARQEKAKPCEELKPCAIE